ncbi:MAG: RapZ C-terminal domain-containing protein [Patescibacteria group bacterium]
MTTEKNVVTVELWSFAASRVMDGSAMSVENPCPIPIDLAMSFELIVNLRHLKSARAIAELESRDGRDIEVKRFFSGNERFSAELIEWTSLVSKILLGRRRQGIDREKTKFRFGFCSQDGRQRSVTFVTLLAKNLMGLLEKDTYLLVIIHDALGEKMVLPVSERQKNSEAQSNGGNSTAAKRGDPLDMRT